MNGDDVKQVATWMLAQAAQEARWAAGERDEAEAAAYRASAQRKARAAFALWRIMK